VCRGLAPGGESVLGNSHFRSSTIGVAVSINEWHDVKVFMALPLRMVSLCYVYSDILSMYHVNNTALHANALYYLTSCGRHETIASPTGGKL